MMSMSVERPDLYGGDCEWTLMSPDPQHLNELVRRIVDFAAPRRIILFGSEGRGEMGRHSDLDVLVVMPDGCNCRQVAKGLYRRMRGFEYAADILVVQQSDVAEHGANPYLIIHTALTEGKELYDAAASESDRANRPGMVAARHR